MSDGRITCQSDHTILFIQVYLVSFFKHYSHNKRYPKNTSKKNHHHFHLLNAKKLVGVAHYCNTCFPRQFSVYVQDKVDPLIQHLACLVNDMQLESQRDSHH